MAQITSDETEFIHIIGSMELAMANVEDEHKMKAKYMNAREPFKKLYDWSKGHAVANQYWYAQLKITFVVEPPFRLKSYILPQCFLEYRATEEDIQRFQEEDESGDKAFSDKDEEHEYEECAADAEEKMASLKGKEQWKFAGKPDGWINSVIGGACNCPNLWEDYDETFTSVVRYETIHMLFNVAAVKSLNVPHFDIKCAHLNAEYQEKLHTEHPHCFEDPSNKNIVWAKFSMPPQHQ
ncbi:hypothetical protein T4C_6558 [Trichinella pseudospiralis]|uniref:Reverse transcriptase Ty1/copia-type domain-containing protein n=3 Tax=Trichinella pseudospiralis TaxID=6337 RepID=A0A0V1J5R9_TRIPS|nr:hypothetical protein T4C_6558 [Trichinella pseudospiralis]